MNAAPPLSDERKGRQHRGLLIASEVYTVLGTVPPVLGSSEVTSILTKGVGGVIGATFVEPDPPETASLMIDHIDEKRRGLGL